MLNIIYTIQKKYKNQNKTTKKKKHPISILVMDFCCSKARVKGADPYCYRTKD